MYVTETAVTIARYNWLTDAMVSPLFPPPDYVIGLEGCHSAWYWLYSRQSNLQAWQRCAYARLLRGGECLSAKVSATHT